MTDTAQKRASVLLVSLPFRPPLLTPDATINDSDRAQVAFLYRGFDYAGDGSGGSTVDWYIMAMRRGTR